MRLSSLCLAAVLILASSASFSQHSSGGGGSSGGSSGGGSSSIGGGSHASSGGSSSSSSSGGSRGSAASVSHSSGPSHGASVRSSANATHPNSSHSIREPNSVVRAKSEMPAKKSFFSFLRHPFRKPPPKPVVAELRRPICFKGPCLVCPAGVHAGGACGNLFIQRRNYCSSSEVWNGGACLAQTPLVDDCLALRTALEQRRRKMQLSESAQQNACAAGPGQACAEMTSAAQSETSFLQTLQNKYAMCRQHSLTAYPLSGPRGSSDSSRLSLAPSGNVHE